MEINKFCEKATDWSDLPLNREYVYLGEHC